MDRPELRLGERFVESRASQTLHAAHADCLCGGRRAAGEQLQLCRRPVPNGWARL